MDDFAVPEFDAPTMPMEMDDEIDEVDEIDDVDEDDDLPPLPDDLPEDLGMTISIMGDKMETVSTRHEIEGQLEFDMIMSITQNFRVQLASAFNELFEDIAPPPQTEYGSKKKEVTEFKENEWMKFPNNFEFFHSKTKAMNDLSREKGLEKLVELLVLLSPVFDNAVGKDAGSALGRDLFIDFESFMIEASCQMFDTRKKAYLEVITDLVITEMLLVMINNFDGENLIEDTALKLIEIAFYTIKNPTDSSWLSPTLSEHFKEKIVRNWALILGKLSENWPDTITDKYFGIAASQDPNSQDIDIFLSATHMMNQFAIGNVDGAVSLLEEYIRICERYEKKKPTQADAMVVTAVCENMSCILKQMTMSDLSSSNPMQMKWQTLRGFSEDWMNSNDDKKAIAATELACLLLLIGENDIYNDKILDFLKTRVLKLLKFEKRVAGGLEIIVQLLRGLHGKLDLSFELERRNICDGTGNLPTTHWTGPLLSEKELSKLGRPNEPVALMKEKLQFIVADIFNKKKPLIGLEHVIDSLSSIAIRIGLSEIDILFDDILPTLLDVNSKFPELHLVGLQVAHFCSNPDTKYMEKCRRKDIAKEISEKFKNNVDSIIATNFDLLKGAEFDYSERSFSSITLFEQKSWWDYLIKSSEKNRNFKEEGFEYRKISKQRKVLAMDIVSQGLLLQGFSFTPEFVHSILADPTNSYFAGILHRDWVLASSTSAMIFQLLRVHPKYREMILSGLCRLLANYLESKQYVTVLNQINNLITAWKNFIIQETKYEVEEELIPNVKYIFVSVAGMVFPYISYPSGEVRIEVFKVLESLVSFIQLSNAKFSTDIDAQSVGFQALTEVASEDALLIRRKRNPHLERLSTLFPAYVDNIVKSWEGMSSVYTPTFQDLLSGKKEEIWQYCIVILGYKLVEICDKNIIAAAISFSVELHKKLRGILSGVQPLESPDAQKFYSNLITFVFPLLGSKVSDEDNGDIVQGPMMPTESPRKKKGKQGKAAALTLTDIIKSYKEQVQKDLTKWAQGGKRDVVYKDLDSLLKLLLGDFFSGTEHVTKTELVFVIRNTNPYSYVEARSIVMNFMKEYMSKNKKDKRKKAPYEAVVFVSDIMRKDIKLNGKNEIKEVIDFLKEQEILNFITLLQDTTENLHVFLFKLFNLIMIISHSILEHKVPDDIWGLQHRKLLISKVFEQAKLPSKKYDYPKSEVLSLDVSDEDYTKWLARSTLAALLSLDTPVEKEKFLVFYVVTLENLGFEVAANAFSRNEELRNKIIDILFGIPPAEDAVKEDKVAKWMDMAVPVLFRGLAKYKFSEEHDSFYVQYITVSLYLLSSTELELRELAMGFLRKCIKGDKEEIRRVIHSYRKHDNMLEGLEFVGTEIVKFLSKDEYYNVVKYAVTKMPEMMANHLDVEKRIVPWVIPFIKQFNVLEKPMLMSKIYSVMKSIQFPFYSTELFKALSEKNFFFVLYFLHTKIVQDNIPSVMIVNIVSDYSTVDLERALSYFMRFLSPGSLRLIKAIAALEFDLEKGKADLSAAIADPFISEEPMQEFNEELENAIIALHECGVAKPKEKKKAVEEKEPKEKESKEKDKKKGDKKASRSRSSSKMDDVPKKEEKPEEQEGDVAHPEEHYFSFDMQQFNFACDFFLECLLSAGGDGVNLIVNNMKFFFPSLAVRLGSNVPNSLRHFFSYLVPFWVENQLMNLNPEILKEVTDEINELVMSFMSGECTLMWGRDVQEKISKMVVEASKIEDKKTLETLYMVTMMNYKKKMEEKSTEQELEDLELISKAGISTDEEFLKPILSILRKCNEDACDEMLEKMISWMKHFDISLQEYQTRTCSLCYYMEPSPGIMELLLEEVDRLLRDYHEHRGRENVEFIQCRGHLIDILHTLRVLSLYVEKIIDREQHVEIIDSVLFYTIAMLEAKQPLIYAEAVNLVRIIIDSLDPSINYKKVAKLGSIFNGLQNMLYKAVLDGSQRDETTFLIAKCLNHENKNIIDRTENHVPCGVLVVLIWLLMNFSKRQKTLQVKRTQRYIMKNLKDVYPLFSEPVLEACLHEEDPQLEFAKKNVANIIKNHFPASLDSFATLLSILLSSKDEEFVGAILVVVREILKTPEVANYIEMFYPIIETIEDGLNDVEDPTVHIQILNACVARCQEVENTPLVTGVHTPRILWSMDEGLAGTISLLEVLRR